VWRKRILETKNSKSFFAIIVKKYIMNKIRKSRASKVIAGFVGFATAITMSFGTASAATTEELTAQIASLLATITSLQTQLSGMQGGAGTTTGGVSYTFATNLKMGMTSTDVMNLQKVLNMNSATQVSATGAGSPGMESTYFGAKTKAAVIKFQELHMAEILTPVGLTKGTGFVGASTRALLNTMSVGTGTGTGTGTGLPAGCTSTAGFSPTTGASCATGVITGGGVTNGTTLNVSLSSDTPVSGTLIAGQAVADLAHFTFTNTTSSEVKVTNLVFNRTGVSNDTTLVNVYLYNGASRLSDSASVSQQKVTFNDASGLFTVPVGGSITVSVKADIAAATSGQIVGVSLGSVVAGTVTVGGVFPLMGNTHTIATADIATVYWTVTTPTPTAAVSVDPQDDFVMWQDSSVSVGIRSVWLKSIMFRQIGSVASGDLGKFRLYVDGTMAGTEVASVGSNGYITFDLGATPLKLETGNHTIKVLGNIIGGSTRTFSLSLQNAGDAVLADSQLNVPVLSAKVSGTSFSALTTGTQTVNAGTLTITKKTDSPSGNTTLSGSGIVLGKFELKANGEPLKIENLRIAVVEGDGDTVSTLRNGALFADGVQVGSTASIAATTDATQAYTQFNLGSSLIVTPGKPVVLEVRSDIFDDDGTNGIIAGDTIAARIVANTSNVKRMNALTYLDNSAVTANTLTVAVGGLSGSKNATYANQTVVTPQTAYKIGSFTIVTTDTEALNLDTLTVNFSSASTTAVATDITDVYLKYGTKTSSIKSTVVAGDNTFSVSETLAPNTTLTIDVYATLNSTMLNSDTAVAKLTASGTTALSSTAKSVGAITGQTITVSSGSISAAFVNDSTLATKLQVGNTMPKVASFRFTALNDTFTITDLAVKVGSNNAAGAIRDITLKSAGMTDKVISLNGLIATSTGLAISVPANDTSGKIVDVYLNLNDVGNNAATSSANVTVTLEGFISNSSTGTRAETATDVTTNAQYIFKSIPTITNVSLPSTLLSAGTKTISKVQISADAAGQVNWKKLVWTIAKSSDVTIGAAGATSSMQLVDSSGNIIAGTFATTTGDVGSSATLYDTNVTSGTLSFTATNEQQITTSETYSLKGTVGGNLVAGKSIATSIATAGATDVGRTYSFVENAVGQQTPSFIWSDRSALSHGLTTADWFNDFKVKNLPTDSQTLSL
jgi:hypothetical protein